MWDFVILNGRLFVEVGSHFVPSYNGSGSAQARVHVHSFCGCFVVA